MKTIAYILIALLAGLMLGSWSIKADLRKANSEIDSLKAQLAQNGKSPASLSGITTMLNLPEVKSEPAPRNKHRHFAPPPAPEPVSVPATNVPSPVPPIRAVASTNSQAMQEQLKSAANLWKVRVDLARSSFISNVTTNEDQAAQFEVSMAAMNLRLSNSIRTWVDQVKTEKQEPSPEKSIRLLNDLSSTLLWAYQDLDRSQPADWRQKAGTKFQVLDFINPEVALPLAETEGVFNRSRRTTPNDD